VKLGDPSPRGHQGSEGEGRLAAAVRACDSGLEYLENRSAHRSTAHRAELAGESSANWESPNWIPSKALAKGTARLRSLKRLLSWDLPGVDEWRLVAVLSRSQIDQRADVLEAWSSPIVTPS